MPQAGQRTCTTGGCPDCGAACCAGGGMGAIGAIGAGAAAGANMGCGANWAGALPMAIMPGPGMPAMPGAAAAVAARGSASWFIAP